MRTGGGGQGGLELMGPMMKTLAGFMGVKPNFEVKPLPENVVTDVVRRWHPGMPVEHAEFVHPETDGHNIEAACHAPVAQS